MCKAVGNAKRRTLFGVALFALTAVAGCGSDAGGGDESGVASGASAVSDGSRDDGAAAGSAAAIPSEEGRATPMHVPAEAGSGQPHLAVGPGGRVVLSWLQPDGDTDYALNFTELESGAWGEARVIARGDDFFVNWADLPSVEPISEDLWIAHWLQMAPDSYASYNIAYAMSHDGGRNWTDQGLLNSDGVLTEHGFATLFPWGNDIGAVWLDGRRLEEQFESGVSDPDAPPVGTSLRYARIADDGTVQDRGEIDELVCDCCQTDVASTAAGPVMVYRDRTAEEIRDIKVRRGEGSGWSPEVALGPDRWQIDGCPVNGPAVAARDDTVAAAWFTAAGDEPKVRLARSSDGGASFGTAVDVDGAGSFGHVDVVLLADGAAVVSWWRRAEAGGLALAVRRVEANGTQGKLRIVAENDSARPLDVPQMAVSGDRLIFAWTDAAESTVKSASLPLR